MENSVILLSTSEVQKEICSIIDNSPDVSSADCAACSLDGNSLTLYGLIGLSIKSITNVLNTWLKARAGRQLIIRHLDGEWIRDMECKGYSAEEVMAMAEKLNTQFILPVNPDNCLKDNSMQDSESQEQGLNQKNKFTHNP